MAIVNYDAQVVVKSQQSGYLCFHHDAYLPGYLPNLYMKGDTQLSIYIYCNNSNI